MFARRRRRRGGAALLEGAIVFPVLMMLTLGTIVVGLGVFRYQEMAWLAREGARWASVHGPTYQAEQGAAAPTASTVMSNAITPKLALLNSANLTCTLSMTNGVATVTLTYAWTPEAYVGSVTMSSTSKELITY